MNREDIIRMARETLNQVNPDFAEDEPYWRGAEEELERFATLVASAERSACAKICEEHSTWTGRMCAETIKARG